MILIAYDGSDDARAAIEQASKLFPGEPATVLTVWQRFVDTMAAVAGGVGMVIDYEEIDKDAEQRTAATAEEGAQFGREAGLQAEPRTAVVAHTIADTVLCEAAAVAADAVVCGSRGHTGLKSLMLGSVSHHILQHADIPVLVVPSPTIAKARADHLERLR